MGIQESEDEDRGDEVEDEEVQGGENTLRRSPPHASKTIANRSICAQLASNRVPTAEIVGDDDDVRMIAESGVGSTEGIRGLSGLQRPH